MSKRTILSTVFYTKLEKHPTGQESPRVRIKLSDADLAKYANEFENRYKLMLSGSTVLSILSNGNTTSMIRVEEFEPGSLKPTKFSHLMGPKININDIPQIEDKRSPDMVGHPMKQIPKPHSLD